MLWKIVNASKLSNFGKLLLTFCLCAQSLSCFKLFCDPMDHRPHGPNFPVHGIFQARILEWVAICYSRKSSQPKCLTHVSFVSYIGSWIIYFCITWEASYNFANNEIQQKKFAVI